MIYDNQYAYLIESIPNWDCFSNRILYHMCEEYPLHNDKDIIAGKIMIIGRTYAAAIERRDKKNTNSLNTERFYNDVVGPKMLEIGEMLDFAVESATKQSAKCARGFSGCFGFA